MNRLFNEAESADIVIERLASCEDPRFRAVMESAIRHLHAFVKEVEPSVEEWATAIEFLTATGKMCDDRRQEWVLASDVLGVSMLVETLNNRAEDGCTEATVLGPFHVDGAPLRALGDTICMTERACPATSRVGSRTWTASRWPGRASTSGRRTQTASTTCSSRRCSRR